LFLETQPLCVLSDGRRPPLIIHIKAGEGGGKRKRVVFLIIGW